MTRGIWAPYGWEEVTCRGCNGIGERPTKYGSTKICVECEGSGKAKYPLTSGRLIEALRAENEALRARGNTLEQYLSYMIGWASTESALNGSRLPTRLGEIETLLRAKS